jgi:cytochrome c5
LFNFPLPRVLARLMAVAALGLAACATQLAPLSEADAARVAAEWPGTTVETLTRGRITYLESCTSCHAAYRPDTQPATAWPRIVEQMASRAKLDRGRRDDVVRYLVAAARR